MVITTNIFIERAKKAHGDKYNYSKVEYKNSQAKIIIICPEHGEFEQQARTHTDGSGCPKCIKRSAEEFINEAERRHNYKYDYSKIVYKNIICKIIIICPIHGEFQQTPYNHLHYGCAKCAGNAKCGVDGFVEKARKIHSNKYDYSKTNYTNAHTKVIIICPEHGEFKQKPNKHLSGGHGCPKCHDHAALTTVEFIERAKEVHGDKFDYSKVEYKNGKTKVIITCKKCNFEFKQKPADHLYYNCPQCCTVISSGHQEIINYVKLFCGEEILINDRKVIFPYELDIYIPGIKLAVEYNGDYWHADKEESHLHKYLLCKENGIKLMQIFEHEWKNPIKHEIIERKLRVLLGADSIRHDLCSIADNRFPDEANYLMNLGLRPIEVLPPKIIHKFGNGDRYKIWDAGCTLFG
jgi:hypothetical protein